MSTADRSTAWKNMSSATRSMVIGGLALGAALVVWLNFVR